MYSVIGMFEVILRNSIDRHFIPLKGSSWLEDAVKPGGYLALSTGCKGSLTTVQQAINKLGLACTHDKLIANLTLGFWTYQFSKKEFAAAGSTLLQIFPNKPRGIHQKDIFKNLIRINETRNRIAHYEPICFDYSGAVSALPVQRMYDLIIEMLGWLGCPQQKILYGIDGVQKAIEEIRALGFTKKVNTLVRI